MNIKKITKRSIKLTTSVCLCLATVLGSLAISDNVNASGYLTTQNPNQFFNANPLVLYSAQTNVTETDHKIWNQACTVTSNNSNVEIYNNRNGPADSQPPVIDIGGHRTKADYIRGFPQTNASSYSFVAVRDYASNPTLTVDYPLVGSYKNIEVGCKVVVSDIVYEETKAMNFTVCNDGLAPEENVPYFCFNNNMYNGFWNFNTKRCTMTYHFYDYETKKEVQLDAGCFLSANSLNGLKSPDWIIPNCEWIGTNNAAYAMVIPDNNLQDMSAGSGFDVKVGGAGNDFDDYIGGPTFNKNSVTIVYDGYTVPSVTFGSEGVVNNGETRNLIWATVATGSLSLNTPSSPYKDVSKTDVYGNDSLTYSVHQTVNKLGEDCVTPHYLDFAMKDIMPDDFTYESVKVVDMSTGGDITSQFNTTYDSGTRSLSCAAKTDYLNSMTLAGQTIRFDITGRVNTTLTDEKIIENTAVTMFNVTDASGGVTLRSNKVETEEHVATVAIDKTSDKASYGIGETAKYTLTITNPGPSTDDTIRGMTVRDQLGDIKGKIDTSTIKIFDTNGADMTGQVNISSATESGFVFHSVYPMSYGQKMTVTYNVLMSEDFSSGSTLSNTARANVIYGGSATDTLTVSLEDKDIKVTKKVKADEVLFANGNPTFMFKLEGTTTGGTNVSRYKSVEFTDADALNVDAQGYMSKTISFDHLFSGNYQVSEVRSVRYDLDTITDLSSGASINGEAVNYDLIAAMGGNATFINKQTNYLKTSHNDIVNNQISR